MTKKEPATLEYFALHPTCGLLIIIRVKSNYRIRGRVKKIIANGTTFKRESIVRQDFPVVYIINKTYETSFNRAKILSALEQTNRLLKHA